MIFWNEFTGRYWPIAVIHFLAKHHKGNLPRRKNNSQSQIGWINNPFHLLLIIYVLITIDMAAYWLYQLVTLIQSGKNQLSFRFGLFLVFFFNPFNNLSWRHIQLLSQNKKGRQCRLPQSPFQQAYKRSIQIAFQTELFLRQTSPIT